jgi:CheY-like chemotaxis protein
MTGAVVADEARRRRPELPILFSSGYSDMGAIETALGRCVTILKKPFDVEALQDALRAALPAEVDG